jgi:hypothetical protein
MSLQINDLVVENTLSASTLTATTLYVGTNSVGGSSSSFNSFSATTFSGGTIYSGTTDLYSIFLTSNDGNDITRVQPGSNITTGGTGNNPTVNLVASPFVNNITFSGTATGNALSATTLSGGTILSGSTNLYSIFATNASIVPTYVQPGSNITTGGTATNPIISVVASPSFNSITASGASSFTTLSATTLISGSTNLYQIFAQTGNTLTQKSGNVSGSTFAGNPKKATVTFATAFANTNYAITISSDTNRAWTWESKTAGSFVINANSNTTFNAGNVNWTAIQYGEK